MTIHDLLRWPQIVMEVSAVEYVEETLRKNSTVPEVDSRRHISLSRREERRKQAEVKAQALMEQITRLEYVKRYGQLTGPPMKLPPLSRRMLRELKS